MVLVILLLLQMKNNMISNTQDLELTRLEMWLKTYLLALVIGEKT